jgi:DNA-binding NarL/FixJ family response regulator
MTTPSIGLSSAVQSPDSARELPVNGLLPSPRTPVHDAPATGPLPVRGATVLLVDPDRATRESLQASLTDIGIGEIREAGTLEAVQEIAAESSGGDLALISVTFGTQTKEIIGTVRRAGWNRVVALAPTADIGPVIDAVGAGVSGVLIGRRANPAASSIPSSIHELSTREIEVIRLVADGRSNKWIGDRLSLSALTVKSHLARIGRKLGTGDRAHMVALAMRAGVIS